MHFLLYVMLLFLSVNGDEYGSDHKQSSMKIGGILDYGSRAGKEEKVAMEMAVDDVYKSTGIKLLLQLRDSNENSPIAVMDLIYNQQVQAVVGTVLWQEVVLASEIVNRTKEVAIISLSSASISPPLLPRRLPNFFHMASDISEHMRCIAAIVSSYQWRRVIAIYEANSPYASDSGLISILSDPLHRVGVQIERYSGFPPLASIQDPDTVIREELAKHRSSQCRVFVLVQSSFLFAQKLFKEAKNMGMIGKGYVWITTDGVASLLDSADSSVVSSMQGVLGFRTYYEDTSASYRDFKVRFRHKYRVEHPDEEQSFIPSIFALRAYDAILVIAKAMGKLGENSTLEMLLEGISGSNFYGLSGTVHFKGGELSSTPTFQVINVVGKSYNELGFWSPDHGFLETIVGNLEKKSGSQSMDVLSPVYWPGGLRWVPRGWTMPTQSGDAEKPLRIGVPARSAFTQFVRVNTDQGNGTRVTGFAVDVFHSVVKHLPYNLPYELVPFDGSYDEMVKQVSYKTTLDAAVGDTDIMADRCRYAEFSQPYAESGLVMVVTAKAETSQDAWMFLKPFTRDMWIGTAGIGMLMGFVVWLNEFDNNPAFGGSIAYQIGTFLWFSFTTLFFAQREPVTRNLSRLVVGAWLFVVLIVTSSYTASLTSMLTVSLLQPSIVDIDFLKTTNAAVGCNGNSFIVRYLVEVLKFKAENVKKITSFDQYPEALQRRDIAAAFFVAPHAKVFLRKYCKGFIMAGPTFKLGGFGFVFPKGSPLIFDISVAILKATESGEIQQLEESMLSSNNCTTSANESTWNAPLGPKPFFGLFLISGCVSAVSLLIVLARLTRNHGNLLGNIQAKIMDIRVWGWALALFVESYVSGHFEMFMRNRVVEADDRRDNPTAEMVLDNIV